ncbi:hypothetical protein DL98DRAFT_572527 [Cadophora sp. DSE1049]|nr:hypothetical protein DL98DRAFT_572527 [Cadophora sp. DSE1049]
MKLSVTTMIWQERLKLDVACNPLNTLDHGQREGQQVPVLPPRNAYIVLNFDLQNGAFEENPAFADVNAEARLEFHRLNPNHLRFEDKRIRLNFARDTIFMDAFTLYSPNVWLDIKTAAYIAAHSTGFNLIQNLQTTLPNNNIAGLTANPSMNNQTFLAGVINTTTRPAADIPATCVSTVAAILPILVAQRDSLLPRWTNHRQQNVIWDTFRGVNQLNRGVISEVTPFFT